VVLRINVDYNYRSAVIDLQL